MTADNSDASDRPGQQEYRSSWLKAFVWPDWSTRRRLLVREARVVIAGAYVLLAVAWLYPNNFDNHSPVYTLVWWGALLVRVFQDHIALLMLVIALVAALARQWRLALAAAPLALLILPAWLHFGDVAPIAPGRPHLRVMSANLFVVNQQTNAMIAEILAADPDVLLLQEYPQHWHTALSQALDSRYPHVTYAVQEDAFGMAIYSRLLFTGAVNNFVPLGESMLPQMRVTVMVGNQEIALYNVHLLPPASLSYVTEHRRMFSSLLEVLRDEPLPFVLSGDFNFTPTTAQARHLSSMGVRDAHAMAGRGRAATWPVQGVFRYLPGIRLDHVYVSWEWAVSRHELGTGTGSDHRQVIVEVVLP